MTSFKKKCILMACGFLVAGIVIFSLQKPCPIEECGRNGLRERVGFPHEAHIVLYDCLVCHHVYDDQRNNILDPGELYEDNPDIRCIACHKPNAAIGPMRAFHRQCIGCHNEESAAGRSSGPNMCSECHRPQETIPPDYEMIIGD
ncbi:MAG: cytochrome c3 family protein [Desulfobacterales bacterium]